MMAMGEAVKQKLVTKDAVRAALAAVRRAVPAAATAAALAPSLSGTSSAGTSEPSPAMPPRRPPSVAATPSPTAPPSAAETPQRLPVPARLQARQGLTVREIDAAGGGAMLEAAVSKRIDHQRGGGFTLRLRDHTGFIDLKFWEPAAKKYYDHASLREGARVRLQGFGFKAFKTPEDLRFALPGRHGCLEFNQVHDGQITALDAPPAAPAAGSKPGPHPWRVAFRLPEAR
eukprot:SRR837773.19159.p1 GENE.SRR837773.19159~~SRR837773.19159.p1  ORF type:complete len:269 (+),score=38.12 SRR837773.19159:118-807(+)